jgi:hypothetical protein
MLLLSGARMRVRRKMGSWWRRLFPVQAQWETYRYPRWKKRLGVLMGAIGIGVTSVGLVFAAGVWFLLAERTPKALIDWLALIFGGACMLGLLVCVALLVLMLYRILKLRTM